MADSLRRLRVQDLVRALHRRLLIDSPSAARMALTFVSFDDLPVITGVTRRDVSDVD